MNQILITKKLYITPELRRKKKMYKVQFFLSVFLVCLLSSYYIYADYDRNKSEEVSKEILQGLEALQELQDEEDSSEGDDDTTVRLDNGVIVIALDDDEEDDNQILQANTVALEKKYSTNSGLEYTVEARLVIPHLGIDYPVISQTTEELLKVSINKYWGPEPNEVGNYCIVGHNYRSGKMFGNLPAIANGDIIQLTDVKYNRTINYQVYDRYQIDPTDTSCTSQLTGGKKEITLITCKEYGTQRLVVKAREVK